MNVAPAPRRRRRGARPWRGRSRGQGPSREARRSRARARSARRRARPGRRADPGRVRDGNPARPSTSPTATVTTSARGPVHERVLDQVADRARERLGVAADGDRRGRIDRHARARQRADEAVESDELDRQRARRVLARECEQVVEQPGEPLRVVLEIGEHVGIRTVPGDVRGVAAQRRQRRTQLVRCVGDEPALGLARPLERGEHGIERLRERPDLVSRAGRWQPVRGIARLADRAGGGREVGQRAQRTTREEERDADRKQAAPAAASEDEHADAMRGLLVRPGTRGDQDGSPRRAARAEVRQRRPVDAQRLTRRAWCR